MEKRSIITGGSFSELVRIGHAGIKEDLMGLAWMDLLAEQVVGWLGWGDFDRWWPLDNKLSMVG